MFANTGNLGIPAATGFGSSVSVNDTINRIVLGVQTLASAIGISGAHYNNLYLLAFATAVYAIMVVWCGAYLLDVPAAVYYAGMAYPNYQLLEELRSSSFSSDNNDNNNNHDVQQQHLYHHTTTTLPSAPVTAGIPTAANHPVGTPASTISSNTHISSIIHNDYIDIEKHDLHNSLEADGIMKSNNESSTNGMMAKGRRGWLAIFRRQQK